MWLLLNIGKWRKLHNHSGGILKQITRIKYLRVLSDLISRKWTEEISGYISGIFIATWPNLQGIYFGAN